MITAEQAQAEGRRQAVRSSHEKVVPLSLWPEDLTVDGWKAIRIPFLGNRSVIRHPYGPPIWKRADVQDFLPTYPYKWFFVDSSGMGEEGEAALTVDGFRQLLIEFQAKVREDGYELGLGIAEAGQFQVHVAAYVRSV